MYNKNFAYLCISLVEINNLIGWEMTKNKRIKKKCKNVSFVNTNEKYIIIDFAFHM